MDNNTLLRLISSKAPLKQTGELTICNHPRPYCKKYSPPTHHPLSQRSVPFHSLAFFPDMQPRSGVTGHLDLLSLKAAQEITMNSVQAMTTLITL